MNPNRTNRIVTGLIVGTLALALVVAACGGLRKALYTAGGGAAGAAVGSAAGPIGTIAGAGIGAGATVMVVENDELRSGDLTGDEALRAQNDELRKLVTMLDGKVAAYASEPVWAWATRWMWRLVAVCIAAIILWAGTKLFLTPRGREGLVKEVGATPLSIKAWFRALFAADGVRHTR